MRIYSKVCYAENNDPAHYMNVYLPDEGDSFPVFLYFHGGGLVHGTENAGKHWPQYLTEQGIAVVSANYRLYPNAKFPDFLDDGANAIAWVKNKMHEYCNVESIFVGGSSAGGYISMMLCFDPQYREKFGIAPEDVAGYVFDAGQPTTHFSVLSERGINSGRQIIDDGAPIYHVGREKKYPPMLILVADNDMKNRYEQTLLLMDTLKWNGHEDIEFHYLHCGHCRYVNRFDENGESIFGKKVCGFIRRISAKEAVQ